MTRAADDFAAIARHLADQQAQRDAAHRYHCIQCLDGGYVRGMLHTLSTYPIWVVCTACGNPANVPRP